MEADPKEQELIEAYDKAYCEMEKTLVESVDADHKWAEVDHKWDEACRGLRKARRELRKYRVGKAQ